MVISKQHNNPQRCLFCNDKEVLTTCKFCDNPFCSKHTLPESHKCKGLRDYKLRKHQEVRDLKGKIHYMEDEQELSKFSKIKRIHQEREEWLKKREETENIRTKISFFRGVGLFFQDIYYRFYDWFIGRGIPIILAIIVLLFMLYQAYLKFF